MRARTAEVRGPAAGAPARLSPPQARLALSRRVR